MPSYSITVRPYRSRQNPNLSAVLRIRHPAGRVERQFFKTIKQAEAEAVAKRADIEKFGVRALLLDKRTVMEASEAIRLLEPMGATIAEVVDFFVEHHKSTTQTVQEACDLYQASREKRGISERHTNTLRQVLGRFTASLGGKSAALLTPEDIEGWLHSLCVSPISVNSYRRLLNAVFQYAADRGVIKKNPVGMVELLKEPKGKVGIITPDQMRALLQAAQQEPDVLATLTIGGFAGIRPEEIARMNWSAIDLGSGLIDCAAEITKTAKHRYVKIEPVLSEWLRPLMCVFSSSNEAAKMNIHEENFRRRWDAVRKAAGFAVRGTARTLAKDKAS
jgi:integrase